MILIINWPPISHFRAGCANQKRGEERLAKMSREAGEGSKPCLSEYAFLRHLRGLRAK
jgi:hypothetical protein